MPTTLEIAQAAELRPIADVASELGIRAEEIEAYGAQKAKVRLDVLGRLADAPLGREILVTAITPTPLGEGKTTTAVGLTQGLNRIGVRAAVTIRQPSLGPIFGIKGSGTGGGYSQVLPMEDINLGLTGDGHAVSTAHNLAAAFLDNHLHHGNALEIDPETITWPRVVDMNDRALRKALIGRGHKAGPERAAEWQITAASEVMAVLALATDLADLRARLGRIIVAERRGGVPVTLEDLHVAGAMAAVLRDAIKPNLVQTLEGGPAFIHAGPFGNIAHGSSSVIADRVALHLADAVVTEAGFGADMGAEKFANIKCRQSGLVPSVAVVVVTVRAMKMHGGVGSVRAGKPLDPALTEENPVAVRAGTTNLVKHIENVRLLGLPAVVAINAFPDDRASEVAEIERAALDAGALAAVVSTHVVDGGAGAEALAHAVWKAACEAPPTFSPLYPDALPLAEKIEQIAVRMYGADGVDLSAEAAGELREIERLGYGHLPICMAKTHLSLSHDPKLKGRPTGFRVPVREARLFAGAGFVTAYCGDMQTMPGLPTTPGGEGIDVDADGNITGLF
jgi:formate--tetrahydrofolate ligase